MPVLGVMTLQRVRTNPEKPACAAQAAGTAIAKSNDFFTTWLEFRDGWTCQRSLCEYQSAPKRREQAGGGEEEFLPRETFASGLVSNGRFPKAISNIRLDDSMKYGVERFGSPGLVHSVDIGRMQPKCIHLAASCL